MTIQHIDDGGQYIDDGGQYIDDLDRRLHTLREAFVKLGHDDDFVEMFKIIHGPGWTRLVDVMLVNALVDATERSVEDARRLRGAILAGAVAICDVVKSAHDNPDWGFK